MVKDAAAAHMKGQEEAYQLAMQQRQQQHISLLQELTQLKQLHTEVSESSMSTDMPGQQQQGSRDFLLQQQWQRLQPRDSGTCYHQQEHALPHVGEQATSRGSDRSNDAVGAVSSGPPSNGGGDNTLRSWWQPSLEPRDPEPAAAAADNPTPEVNSVSQTERQSSPPEPTAMSSLITAVLGTGREAKAVHAAHVQRTQQQKPAAAVHSTAALLHSMDYNGQLAELDQVLGLKLQAKDGPSVCSSRQPQSPDRARPAAPFTTGKVIQQSAVAEHIKRPAAVDKLHQSAVRSRNSSKSPPATRHQQQQRDQRTVGSSLEQSSTASSSSCKACLRCGSNDASSPGRCCFHPGFVPVPGPLMYGMEWHACRASCTPDMPGCYSRREHYYLPQAAATAGMPKAAAQLGSKECRGKPRSAVAERLAATAAAAVDRAVVSPMRVHAGSQKAGQANAQYVGNMTTQQRAGRQCSDGEWTPRSTLPKPATPRMCQG